MSRKPLSDREKIARRTFRRDKSEDARALIGLTKVHAFPTFREIPRPTVPLGQTGQAEYDTLSRVLFDAGRLTLLTQRSIEALAVAKDAITMLHASGKPASARILEQMNRALGDLRLADVDPTITPREPEKNRFARSGFAARRWAANRDRGG
jgi:hypothetical protein